MVINSFWYGASLPLIGKLCIKSFLDKGFEFHLWSYSKSIIVPEGCVLRDASEILDSSLVFMNKSGSYAPFSDWFRFTLLHKHGGTWVDMDMICLNHFDLLTNSICEELPGMIAMGIINLEQGHPMAKNLIDAYENPSIITDYDSQERVSFKNSIRNLSVEEQRKVAPWGFLGNDLLRCVVNRYKFNKLNISDFYPISYTRAKQIYNGCAQFEEIKDSKCIHLWGEFVRRNKQMYTKDSIMKELITLYS